MQRTLRGYLYRAGVDTGALDDATAELWQEVVREALRHEARFVAGQSPRAWLLGIAANLIRRQQTEISRRQQREPLARDLYPNDALSDDEVFERVAALTSIPDELDQEEAVSALLHDLPAGDQQLVRLAVLHGLDGRALARVLDISPGAARVRLHRALERLRRRHLPLVEEGKHEN